MRRARRNWSSIPWIAALAGLLVAVGCACDGSEPDPPDGSVRVDGVFEVVSEGTGENNARTLFPLHGGTLFAHRHAAVRPPVEVAAGVTAYRYIAQPASASAEYPGARNESWLVPDEDGVWLLGDTQEGMREHPFLIAPATVRVGMRWRTGGGDDVRTYEVLERAEVDGELGPVVLWLITRDDDRPAYFLHGEGWGQLTATFDAPPAVEVPRVLREPIRVVEGEREAAQDPGPRLSLEPVAADGEELLGALTRVDTLRAIRHGGETVVDLQGVGAVFTEGRYRLTLRAARVTVAGGEVRAGGELPGRGLPPSIEPVPPYYQTGGSGEAVVTYLGNVHHRGAEVVWTAEELLLWENELGGLNGGTPTSFVGQTELPLVEPTFGHVGSFRGSTFLPIFGGHPAALSAPPGRTLLSSEGTPSRVPFAIVTGTSVSLRASRMVDFGDGRRIEPYTFVEAFPELRYRSTTSPNEDLRGPAVHTTSSADGQEHLVTTPGGVIDRIEVDLDGARRVRLGHVALPAGHSLQAAARVDDGTLLVFTYARLEPFGGPGTSVWTASLSGTPQPVTPPPFAEVEWLGWDARVCWPGASDAAVEPTAWRLGPAPAADVLPMDGDCVLVTRDVVRGPMPPRDLTGPEGWRVVEGEIPGVGRLRAFEPEPVVAGPSGGSAPPTEGAVTPDGGAELGVVTGPGEGYTLSFDAWGVPAGGATGARIPELDGAHGWALRPVYERPTSHCGMGCSLDGFWSFVYVGPEPATFRLRALPGTGTGGIPARGGGLLIDGGPSWIEETDHRGFMLLGADGSITEITTPVELNDVRTTAGVAYASGSYCGIGGDVAVDTVFCADFDGTITRSIPLAEAPTPLTGPHGGWLMLDDATALAAFPSGGGAPALARLALPSLAVLPYDVPEGIVPDGGAFHADGVYYTREGAWLPSGFVPLADIVDVATLTSEEGATIERFLVLGEVVVLSVGAATVRLPRSRWGITPCEPTTAPGLDADGDGFVAASSCGPDCADGDDAVYPGAPDPCGDGVDADCDGDPDSGVFCWTDEDGDGYAPEGAGTMSACDCPAGWTAREPSGADVDCTDQDANAFPGQTEFFGAPATGAGVGRAYDFDCDGEETARYGLGGCGGLPGCEVMAGFAGATPCGTFGPYLGCAEVGMCGRSCVPDPGGGFCGFDSSAELLWRQLCR